MGILKRLLGKETTPQAPQRRDQAGLPKGAETRRESHEPLVVRITQKIREWDVPDADEADIWWRGFDLHDENDRGWTWDDATLASAGLVIARVAGVQFHKGILLDDVRPGRVLRLIPEPHNEYDVNAIAVWDEAEVEQIGYLPREVAAAVSQRLVNGEPLQAMCIAELVDRSKEEVRVGLRLLVAPSDLVENWPTGS